MVTMHYFGPNLNISSDLSDEADDVLIDQQLAAGGTINVFRDVVQRGC